MTPGTTFKKEEDFRGIQVELLKRMDAKGWGYERLSLEAGVARCTVSKLINHGTTSLLQARKIADALGFNLKINYQLEEKNGN